MGIAGVDQAASLDLLTMQNEVIAYVESTMRELDISDEALGLDLLEKLGPGGSFIDTDHTFERFRKELWMPKLLDRSYYQAWLDSGAKSMEQRCSVRKQEILDSHIPDQMDEKFVYELDSIVSAAKKELGD